MPANMDEVKNNSGAVRFGVELDTTKLHLLPGQRYARTLQTGVSVKLRTV